MQKDLENINNDIASGIKKCRTFEEKTASFNEQSVKMRLEEITATIKRLNAKQNEMKISQQIKSKEAEIDILQHTIEDLEKQQNTIPEKLKKEY